MKKTKVVILGGGFDGLYAAMHLAKKLACRPDVDITLISRENFFLFTPMLHEVAAGDLYPADIVNPIRLPQELPSACWTIEKDIPQPGDILGSRTVSQLKTDDISYVQSFEPAKISLGISYVAGHE